LRERETDRQTERERRVRGSAHVCACLWARERVIERGSVWQRAWERESERDSVLKCVCLNERERGRERERE
jgi:hypothetical protein